MKVFTQVDGPKIKVSYELNGTKGIVKPGYEDYAATLALASVISYIEQSYPGTEALEILFNDAIELYTEIRDNPRVDMNKREGTSNL